MMMLVGGSVPVNTAVSEWTRFSEQPDGADRVGHGGASVLADVVDDLNGQLGCGWGAGGRAGGVGRRLLLNTSKRSNWPLQLCWTWQGFVRGVVLRHH